jgi:hypothetical protein
MAAAGGDEAGAGASLNSTLRQIGGAVAVAVLGSILSASYGRDLHPALSALPASQAAVAGGSISQAAQLAARLGGRPGSALQAAAGAAYLHGMNIVMLICAGVAALTALASLRYLPGRAAPGDTLSLQAPAAAASETGTRR